LIPEVLGYALLPMGCAMDDGTPTPQEAAYRGQCEPLLRRAVLPDSPKNTRVFCVSLVKIWYFEFPAFCSPTHHL
jgi:hypothetical protein